jgi:hypothetical protein
MPPWSHSLSPETRRGLSAAYCPPTATLVVIARRQPNTKHSSSGATVPATIGTA